MSMSDYVSKFHNYVANAVHDYKGHELSKKFIQQIITYRYPGLQDKINWIFPSDHSSNLTNKGACYCALTDEAIFERISRGRYNVL